MRFSLSDKIKLIWKIWRLEIECKEPPWFFYDIYENGYVPHGRDLIKRALVNFSLFVLIVGWVLAVSLIGLKTTVFELITIISNSIGMPQIIWLGYGVVFGIAGSVIFCSIGNPYNSVHTRFITTLHYILYYALFFIVLNIFCYLIVIAIIIS